MKMQRTPHDKFAHGACLIRIDHAAYRHCRQMGIAQDVVDAGGNAMHEPELRQRAQRARWWIPAHGDLRIAGIGSAEQLDLQFWGRCNDHGRQRRHVMIAADEYELGHMRLEKRSRDTGARRDDHAAGWRIRTGSREGYRLSGATPLAMPVR